MSGQNKITNKMLIRASGAGGNFTSMLNSVWRDPEVPFAEKGLLGYMISHPADFNLSLGYILATNKTIGLKGLRSLMRGLEKRGFVAVLPQKREEGGVFGHPLIIASDDREEVKKQRSGMNRPNRPPSKNSMR